MTPEIDFYMGTARQRERLPTLLANVRTALACPIPTRVTIAMGGPYPELASALHAEERDRVRIIDDAPEGWLAGPATKYVLETLDWAPWWMWIGDDDVLLPWGLEHLYSYTKRVPSLSMVIGKALVVSKHDHLGDPSYMSVGDEIRFGRVTSIAALFKTKALLSMNPCINTEVQYQDLDLCERMAEGREYIFVPNHVVVLSCDLKEVS